jgi:hypothetical protein
VSILPTAIAIPSTDSIVNGYRIAMTPDRLLGRVESVRSTIALVIAPLGPLAAGFLLGAVSARATIGVFAAFGLVLAVWGTLSPSIRATPSLDKLAALPGGELLRLLQAEPKRSAAANRSEAGPRGIASARRRARESPLRRRLCERPAGGGPLVFHGRPLSRS